MEWQLDGKSCKYTDSSTPDTADGETTGARRADTGSAPCRTALRPLAPSTP
jgi:hypothetical protein